MNYLGKSIISFIIMILLGSCDKNKQSEYSLDNDTIVIKNIRNISDDTAFTVQIIKEGDYIVSLRKQKSKITHQISKRNDGKVVIRREFFVPMNKDEFFKFNELKFILKEAKKDFKLDSLNYIIYGTLSESNDIRIVEDITQKYIKSHSGSKTINTSNYSEIENLILHFYLIQNMFRK